MSSRDSQPHHNKPYLQSRLKRSRAFGKSKRNAAPLLQIHNGILNQMPMFIDVFVIFSLLNSVSFRRNDDVDVVVRRITQYFIGVVSLVRQQMLGFKTFNQCFAIAAIRIGTRCNNNSDWHTMRIHGQMYLGVDPPFVRLMSWLPPTAPVACLWTLMCVASIISHSKSGSCTKLSRILSQTPLSRQRQNRRCVFFQSPSLGG